MVQTSLHPICICIPVLNRVCVIAQQAHRSTNITPCREIVRNCALCALNLVIFRTHLQPRDGEIVREIARDCSSISFIHDCILTSWLTYVQH